MRLKQLFLVSCSIFALSSTGFSNIHFKPFFEKPVKIKTITARITYYGPHEDRYGSRVACDNRRAKQGETIAAHSNFPFYTKIQIPELEKIIGKCNFIVEDRGSAVQKKKASRGKCFVFDIFLNKRNKELNRFASKMPQYMKVNIL